MTREEFRAYLRDMQRLHPVAKRERFQHIRAGAQVSLESNRGGFVSLTQVIEDGVAVSQAMHGANLRESARTR